MYKLAAPGVTRRFGISAALIMFLAALGGCVSTPEPPTASLAKASEAIASAEYSGARQYAGAELDEAKHKLMQAERALEAENMIEAEQLANQARIAAELAIATTESAKAAQINRQLHQDADALDEEMKRTGEQR